MSTATQLAAGPEGAIRCDFRVEQSQLVFTEYSTGGLSGPNLFPTVTIVAQSATTILKGAFGFDFDEGVEGGIGAIADVCWNQHTAVERSMGPCNTATILSLGAVDFNGVGPVTLSTLPYGTAPIPGSNDATNQLAAGDVFAVKTTSGNFAKAQVIGYGYDLTIRWMTYKLSTCYTLPGAGDDQLEDVS